MAQEKRLFPAQEKSEKVIEILRRHWFVYCLFWMVAFFMLIPFGVIIFIGLENISPVLLNVLFIFGPMYTLIILGLLIYGFIDYYLDVYIVTDRRIVDIAQNGFFKRTISELGVTEIQDVNAEVNGFMATLLHFGDVHIQTAGEKPNFVFESVPHPYETSKKILDLHETHSQKKRREEKEATESEGAKTASPSTDEEENEVEYEKNCYSEDTCNQKILEGLNKHVKEEPEVLADKAKPQEGELSEGEEVEVR